MRSNEELRAEEARIRALLDGGGEAELMAIPGVVQISVGLKQINGTATDEFCIRVYVVQKKELASIPPSERVPKIFRGVPTDVNEVRVVSAHEDTARYRPITGGIQITNGQAVPGGILVGTLGCLATDNTDASAVLLTNFHVIGGNPGDSVFQAFNNPADLIAVVKRGQITGTIDAAIAAISPGVATTTDEVNGLFLNLSNHIAGVTDPVGGMKVFKVGRTTGLTDGKIVDSNAPVVINYDPPIGSKAFTKTMMIQCTKISGCCCCTCSVADGSREFSDHGDSGSVVLSDKRMAVGLIMGGGGGESFACRMTEVESGMNITINRTVVVPSSAVVPDAVGGVPHGRVAPLDAIGAANAGTVSVPNADETVWSIMQRRLEETPLGRELGNQVRLQVPEIIDLVNHHRAVMVAWQRVQGPAFLAQWMNGVRNPSVVVPREIGGVTMNSALLRMATVLKSHGSPSLQRAIDDNAVDLMAALDRSATVNEFLENIGHAALA